MVVLTIPEQSAQSGLSQQVEDAEVLETMVLPERHVSALVKFW